MQNSDTVEFRYNPTSEIFFYYSLVQTLGLSYFIVKYFRKRWPKRANAKGIWTRDGKFHPWKGCEIPIYSVTKKEAKETDRSKYAFPRSVHLKFEKGVMVKGKVTLNPGIFSDGINAMYNTIRLCMENR